MSSSMFDELKEVKYFEETTDFKSKLLEESSESRGVFRTQANIYDGAFFVNILNCLLFSQKKLHHRCLTGLYIALRKY